MCRKTGRCIAGSMRIVWWIPLNKNLFPPSTGSDLPVAVKVGKTCKGRKAHKTWTLSLISELVSTVG